ncbi:MAG: hypothetical protein GY745_14040 [Actinomycetia bacterium]|nr:hypothetical protein [Actinomycetes bacterium]
MAGGDINSRALLNRRRALQVSAGAVFSAPTVISLAKTPAYAVCASAPIVIDDFSCDQAPETEKSHSSFLFGQRYLEHETTFSSGSLTMDYTANSATPGVKYGRGMVGDLVGCGQLVLQNVTTLFGALLVADLYGAGGSGSMIGAASGTDITFDLTTIDPLVLTAPTSLSLVFNAAIDQDKGLVADGPLTVHQ